MGIPKFYGEWFSGLNIPGLTPRKVMGTVTSVSIDMNGVIHRAAQKVYGYGDFAGHPVTTDNPTKELYEEVYRAMQEQVEIFQPRFLVAAVDGVAPKAKCNQQRSRRYKASETKSVFESNSITPGTSFMVGLDTYLKGRLKEAPLMCDVIYSGHLTPGEGEHKIFDFFRDGTIPSAGKHIIHGLDADLFILSLLSPVGGIHLYRESKSARDDAVLVSIDVLKDGLVTRLGTPTAPHQFAVIMSFFGNDFLPNLVEFTDLKKSLNQATEAFASLRAREAGFSLVKDGEVFFPGVKTLLRHMTSGDKMTSVMLGVYMKLTVPTGKDRFMPRPAPGLRDGEGIRFAKGKNKPEFDLDRFTEGWYRHWLTPSNPALEEVYHTEESINLVCKQYLTGVAWVYRYYTSGPRDLNDDFIYDFLFPPLATDLVNYSGALDSIRASPKQVYFNPVHQLLAVLPSTSSHLVPKEFVHLMTHRDSVIFDLYPDPKSIEFEEGGKTAEYQFVPILPPMEPYRIIEAVYKVLSVGRVRREVFELAEPQPVIRFQSAPVATVRRAFGRR